MKRTRGFKTAGVLLAVISLISFVRIGAAFAERWTFAATSDSRSEFAAFTSVLQQIKFGLPEDPGFPPAQFVLGIGDIDPLIRTVIIYREVMGSESLFIPVRGNHEGTEDVRLMLKKVLPGLGLPLEYYDSPGNPSSATYYFDWKNARFIVIDRYTDYARELREPDFLQWLEKAIGSAVDADHIFIAFHEPYAPFSPENDPFWGILIRNGGKVRAVFNGHTHCYMRNLIPCTRKGGIYLINAGNAGTRGHSDGNLTAVEVAINGKEASFRAIQAPHGTGNFTVTDRWTVEPGKNSRSLTGSLQLTAPSSRSMRKMPRTPQKMEQ